MPTLRKPLGILCLLAALVLLVAYYLNAILPAFPDPVWNVVDALAVVMMAVAVLINVLDSLRIRRDPDAHLRQLPRDAITVIAALTLMLFLHNSLLFAAPHATENVPLWQYLDPAAVAVLTWEGIALLRSRSRSW